MCFLNQIKICATCAAIIAAGLLGASLPALSHLSELDIYKMKELSVNPSIVKVLSPYLCKVSAGLRPGQVTSPSQDSQIYTEQTTKPHTLTLIPRTNSRSFIPTVMFLDWRRKLEYLGKTNLLQKMSWPGFYPVLLQCSSANNLAVLKLKCFLQTQGIRFSFSNLFKQCF